MPKTGRRSIRMPSPAMTVACIALAVALSGASYAAVALPRNSVGTAQLKRNAVTSAKVRNNVIRGIDVNEATLGTVPSANTANAANSATNATSATHATNATNATNADRLDNLDSTELMPTYIQNTLGGGPLDIDTSPVLCQTAAHAPAAERIARVDSWVSAKPAAAALMGFTVRNVYSTNGGATWANLDAFDRVSRTGSSVLGQWTHATGSSTLNLNPGTSYMFGVMVGREVGTTTDAGDHRCEVIVELNRR